MAIREAVPKSLESLPGLGPVRDLSWRTWELCIPERPQAETRGDVRGRGGDVGSLGAILVAESQRVGIGLEGMDQGQRPPTGVCCRLAIVEARNRA